MTERHEEQQYIDLIRDILENGVERTDRTGTGTLSVFGRTMRFSLRNNQFPLFTTKRTFWRGIAEELLWFISGSTNCKELHDKKVNIWDSNVSRETLDKLGFTERPEWDLGPGYGYQWRSAFSGEYKDMNTDYKGQGIDQLKNVIHSIKNNPNGRRHIVCSWNCKDVPNMSLPPCHILFQLYVANGKLSLCMYQRSCDMGLGVPFNIGSYALLTRLIAHVCGLEAEEFVWMGGDVHVYLNHVDALKEQIQRNPLPFPTLEINPLKTDIDCFTFQDFKLENYKSHSPIKMKMST